MADDSVVVVDDDESKIVTKFLLNTCRLRQPSRHHVQAAARCSAFAAAQDTNLSEHRYIPLITGSSAEFYIQPMLSFVGDIDLMSHQSSQLALPEGYQPPTELPAEFYSYVDVCQIIDSEYPGYVCLMLSYLLTEDSDTGKYHSVGLPCSLPNFISMKTDHLTTEVIHGPAVTLPASEHDLSSDEVPCVRCLSWPLQAADWPTRHRNCDWPDSATVDHVVNNGCDIVRVAHPLCRQDEWMSKAQCRLSFSRAEIVLLNSWMLVQQIAYHMLRVFVKTERLTDITGSTGTKIISNYHFKTLMMWACERKPQSWWIDDMNVVSICIRLLHILSDWLQNKTCPHYFVNNCNLIYNTDHLEVIVSKLSSITESWLSTWFVNNYLRKCAQLCPDRVSQFFDDVSTSMKLRNAVSAVVDWRRISALTDLCSVCHKAKYYVSLLLCNYPLTLQSCRVWMNELVKIDSCFPDYFTAVAFLHVANRIKKTFFQ